MIPPDRGKLLERISLFSDTPEVQRADIANCCTWSRYGRNRQVVGQNDETTDVFFLVEGRVRIKVYSATGREVTYTDIGGGDLFGEFSAIDSLPRSASVVVLEDSIIGRMNAADFKKTLADQPTIALKLMEHLVHKTRSLTNRVFELSTLAVRDRIHAELLRLADQEEVSGNSLLISPAPTHYELATRVSSHREAVTRELNYLASENLIAVSRGKIEILDVARLRGIVNTAINL